LLRQFWYRQFAFSTIKEFSLARPSYRQLPAATSRWKAFKTNRLQHGLVVDRPAGSGYDSYWHAHDSAAGMDGGAGRDIMLIFVFCRRRYPSF
jgi:hypothetical protein